MTKLNELFDVTYGNKFDLNKMELLPRSEGGISFVGRSEKNLGVSATVSAIEGLKPYPAGLITVALGGTKLLCSYVQQFPFYTAQNVAVLRPKEEMAFNQLVYICACIKANRFRYGAFGREANRTLRVLEIPDIKHFPCWLAEVEEHSVVDSNPASLCDITLDTAGWVEFVLEDIFEIRKGSRLTKAQQKPGKTPYLGTIDRNNGVSNYIAQDAQHEGGTISVNYNGSVAEAFYQPEPFWASDDVNVLYLRNGRPISPSLGLFVATIIRREKYRYNYGRKWGLERMRSSAIKLPAKRETGNSLVPDWGYMERYVNSLPYSSGLN